MRPPPAQAVELRWEKRLIEAVDRSQTRDNFQTLVPVMGKFFRGPITTNGFLLRRVFIDDPPRAVTIRFTTGEERSEAIYSFAEQMMPIVTSEGVDLDKAALAATLYTLVEELAPEPERFNRQPETDGDRSGSPAESTRLVIAMENARELADKARREMSLKKVMEKLTALRNKYPVHCPDLSDIAHRQILKVMAEELTGDGIIPSSKQVQPQAMVAMVNGTGVSASLVKKDEVVEAEATTSVLELQHRVEVYVNSLALLTVEEPTGEETYRGALAMLKALRKAKSLNTSDLLLKVRAIARVVDQESGS